MKKRFLVIFIFIILIFLVLYKRFNKNACTFVRTYYIDKINNIDDNYYYLTIKQYLKNDSYKLKLDKNLYDDIHENYNYEFLLEKSNHNKIKSLKDVFNNTKIVSITKTENIGLSQKQDKVCK